MDQPDYPQQHWYIDCSDDDNCERKWEYWLPDSRDILRMYEILEKSSVLEISWQCPGRLHPNTDEVNNESENVVEEERSPECTDFDFADEVAAPKLVRRSEEARGSARKKTTSFDSVVSNMQRHRQLEQRENQKADQ